MVDMDRSIVMVTKPTRHKPCSAHSSTSLLWVTDHVTTSRLFSTYPSFGFCLPVSIHSKGSWFLSDVPIIQCSPCEVVLIFEAYPDYHFFNWRSSCLLQLRFQITSTFMWKYEIFIPWIKQSNLHPFYLEYSSFLLDEESSRSDPKF